MKTRYIVKIEADNSLFDDACKKIEEFFPGIIKMSPLFDVDESVYIDYMNESGKLTICNDYYLDMVYIDSDINLEILGYRKSKVSL